MRVMHSILRPLHAARGLGPGLGPMFRWALCAALVAMCGLHGALAGLGDTKSWAETEARYGRELETQIAYVEDMSILADLDARSNGPWDRYMTESRETAVMKGGLTRHFEPLSSSVFLGKGEPSYAVTQGLSLALCNLPVQVLAESPLAGRMEIAWSENHGSPRQQWRPIAGAKDKCLGYGNSGLVWFRVTPQDSGGRIRTGDLSATGGTK